MLSCSSGRVGEHQVKQIWTLLFFAIQRVLPFSRLIDKSTLIFLMRTLLVSIVYLCFQSNEHCYVIGYTQRCICNNGTKTFLQFPYKVLNYMHIKTLYGCLWPQMKQDFLPSHNLKSILEGYTPSIMN